ncbi:homoisocitrate dehydrogenase [Methanothermobacter wolfeii]|uniref:Homoisocitrate dehydrogenase n=1 Tax=Methanothermobacter wolfeii TaxID=145261 RepID=A0ABU8TY56_METWO|nr:homoisocitrate dehydrogenase [Methanothermobacter sp. THM-1]QHN06106.1 NAD-dependent isocitrate dehydrogenase [Methanothermobacter sp. THM-1]SCM56598.1 3-isopropylmalate dehydrogenase [Methanothermobacter wolfeii]
MYRITVIPGDGIGGEVMDAALTVLDAVDLEFEFTLAEAGDGCFRRCGETIPDETIRLVRKADATLFGAVTTVPGQKSAIITLRRELDLFANLRPVRSLPGVPCLYPDLDFVIVRENTEDLYVGDEEYTSDGAVARRVITRAASERIVRFAFDYAVGDGRGGVTAVHKANVLKKTDGIFREVFYEVASSYPQVEANDYYVDATAMYLITQPHEFDVIVTTNMFGDILSDEAAALVGGLGVAPSANIGKKNAIFEPVHGSAPQIAGKNIANPTAMILSTALMLKHLKKPQEAQKIQEALERVLKKGVMTPDLGGTATTSGMADAVRKEVLEL